MANSKSRSIPKSEGEKNIANVLKLPNIIILKSFLVSLVRVMVRSGQVRSGQVEILMWQSMTHPLMTKGRLGNYRAARAAKDQ